MQPREDGLDFLQRAASEAWKFAQTDVSDHLRAEHIRRAERHLMRCFDISTDSHCVSCAAGAVAKLCELHMRSPDNGARSSLL